MSAGGSRNVGGRFAPRPVLAPLAALACVGAILAAPAGAAGATAPEGFLGVSAPRAKSNEFARMARGGVGTYRTVILWRQVQPGGSGEYEWGHVDKEIRDAAKNGIRPLATLYGSAVGGNPRRAPIGSEHARRGWKRFVRAAVARYGPDGEFWSLHPELPHTPVDTWQAWNEQNSSHFWHGPGPSPKRYAKLVRLTDTAVDDVDPAARVVLGGMFGNPNGSRSIRMSVFLQRLYRARSLSERFDGIALHPYAGTVTGVARQIEDARGVLIRHGDDRTGIWITEIGWSTDGPDGWKLVTSREGQARKLEAAFQMLIQRRARYGLQSVVWFSWRDFKDPECAWCGASGLFSRSGKPKPAWFEYARLAGGSP